MEHCRIGFGILSQFIFMKFIYNIETLKQEKTIVWKKLIIVCHNQNISCLVCFYNICIST